MRGKKRKVILAKTCNPKKKFEWNKNLEGWKLKTKSFKMKNHECDIRIESGLENEI